MTSYQMSTMTYDQLFETVLGVAVCGIVLATFWIVGILVNIEATKQAAFYTVSVDVDGDGTHSLEMHEETTEASNGSSLEVEPAPKPSSPTMANTKKRPRRIRTSFKLMQLASVCVLLLLTYLLLVVSEAPMWASALGSLCVFGVFLRYQIGDELRRQRLDRICLMLSLFLFIASLMSLCTYAFKSLANGEVYEGPARIVGYDFTGYNNSAHDPNTRTDLEVQWGKTWGCPLSGGKVCQGVVQGAMCTANMHDEDVAAGVDNGDRRRNRKQRRAQEEVVEVEEEEEILDEEVVDEAEENQDLESENQELETENQELEKEVEELELENEEEKEVATEEVEEVEAEEEEDAAIYDEDIETVEEEELMIEEEYTDAYVEVEEEEIEVEEEYETDPNAVAEDEEVIDELVDEKDEIDEVYEEYEDEYAENAEDFEEEAETAEQTEEEIDTEEEETKAEYEDAIEEVAEGATTEGEDEELLEEAAETTEGAVGEEEEEEEYEEEEEEDWYWEEISYEYDDDMYSSEYWDYEWDSAWGEYTCEDLFDEDTDGMSYDTSKPAGTDEYPYINIYGSCKTCEAYVLDYFAEEAFESVEEHKQLAIVYMAGAIAGFIFTFISFIKYKVSPTAENEIELLGSDGGVMA